MTAENIAKALGGRKAGGSWIARCPAHEDRKPSLCLKDAGGKVLVHCHAGCEQMAVIAALRARGVWPECDRARFKLVHPRPCETEHSHVRDDPARTELALRIWRTAVPAVATPVEAYLRARGIDISVPTALRFHGEIKHPRGEFWPAMVALVTRGTDDAPLAIHRTFLARDRHGKAPVEPQKMMLGPCRGGAVRLGQVGDVLLIGEGIETCLAAMQATGNPAWAALSTSGLRTLDLPAYVREFIVLADGDEPGESAAREAALRWNHEGRRRVRIARAPRGFDFNDVLLGRAFRRVEGET